MRMAAQNVLAGDERVLVEIIEEVKEQNSRTDSYNKLSSQIRELTRDVEDEKKSLQASIDTKIKQSSAAICAGFDKSIDEERAKLRDIQSDRERAKDAGVKERISAETAHLRHENEKLKSRIRESFKTNGVPGYCNNALFMMMFRTTGVLQYLLYFLLLTVFYAVIPTVAFLVFKLQTLYIIIYYFVCILIQSFVGKVIYKKTIMQHFATLDAAARMQSDIKDNNRRMKEVRDNIKDIESQKKAALQEFEQTVKPNIIAELETVDKDKRDAMENRLFDMNERRKSLDEQIKQKRLYISSNYEAYLGKEVFDIDKLLKLLQIIRSGQADTIAKALAVYESKNQN